MSNKRCSVCLALMDVFGYSRKEKHTIYQCPKCGNQEILRDADVPLPIHTQTVFDRITASPDVLAEKFVYHGVTSWDDDFYASTICDETFETRAEAIAATVAKLKEVEK